jgi:EAL domain-containing protein (putative c-di-GMP-specific phosphodiesterase class I)
VDTLKIDRTFIQQMDKTAENMRIVQSIVDLAHNLSMNVVAEGVETESQRQQLADLQCEFVQGYLFSRPIDSALAEKLLAANALQAEHVGA